MHLTTATEPSLFELQRRGADQEGEGVVCIGNGTAGHRVQAIYAHPSDRPSRYEDLLPAIRRWAALNVEDIVNASARRTGGIRHVRFVTDESCRLDVNEVQVSASADDSFGQMRSELIAQGYDDAQRKYLVWMDSPQGTCLGDVYPDDSPGDDNLNNGGPGAQALFAEVGLGCWGQSGTRSKPSEAHELFHTLGAVQQSAPHFAATTPPRGHCQDEWDVMCESNLPATQFNCPIRTAARLLDCGNDDYFHTDPPSGSYLATHWNTARSRWLHAGLLNDSFGDAERLAGWATSGWSLTTSATAEAGEPSHAGASAAASVWYRWIAPESGPVVIDTSESTFDTLLAVYTGGALNDLAPVSWNDDEQGATTSEVAFTAVGGTEYRIAVDGWGGASGPMQIDITLQPSNDDFDDARILNGTTITSTGVTAGATKEPGEPDHVDAGGRSVWFRWQAPSAGSLSVDTHGSDFDTLLAAYTGLSPGALSMVQGNDEAPGRSFTSSISVPVDAGTIYRIAVDGYRGDFGAADYGSVVLNLSFTPAQRTLTVSKGGSTGGGTVTSSPSAISCGSTCIMQVGDGSQVTLTAEADEGSTFNGWSGGGCSGTGSCQVTLTADSTITATFGLAMRTLDVDIAGQGAGEVSSEPAGIDCPSDCSEALPYGSEITLEARPAEGSTFGGWTGSGCSDVGTCRVTLTRDTEVMATFVPASRSLTVITTGDGSVSSQPSGIECPPDCSHTFDHGSGVTLTPRSAGGSRFVGWARGCAGLASCIVTMTADRTVEAVFAPLTAKRVDLRASGTRVVQGRRVRLQTSVSPCGGHAGERIELSFGSRTESKITDSACSATFVVKVRKRTTFQAISPQQDDDHLTGQSTSVTVRVRRR